MNRFDWLGKIIANRTVSAKHGKEWVAQFPESGTMHCPLITLPNGAILMETTHHGNMRNDAFFVASMASLSEPILAVINAAQAEAFYGETSQELRDALTALDDAKSLIGFNVWPVES